MDKQRYLIEIESSISATDDDLTVPFSVRNHIWKKKYSFFFTHQVWMVIPNFEALFLTNPKENGTKS